MTTAIPTKRSPAVCEVRCDATGIKIHLPKASAVALTRCRDVLAGLAAAAPIVSAKANGIRKALDGLIDDLGRNHALPADDSTDINEPSDLE